MLCPFFFVKEHLLKLPLPKSFLLPGKVKDNVRGSDTDGKPFNLTRYL